MPKFFISKSLIVACAAALATACTAGNAASTHEMVATKKGEYIQTAKPGAAVEFRQIGSNKITDMNSREIRIQIIDGYDAGTLTVNVINNEALSLSGSATSYAFDMSGSTPHEIAVNVNPLVTGKLYLNFNAVAEYGAGQVARTQYAVPIYADTEPQKGNAESLDTAERTTTAPGIVVMDAEETIITKSPE